MTALANIDVPAVSPTRSARWVRVKTLGIVTAVSMLLALTSVATAAAPKPTKGTWTQLSQGDWVAVWRAYKDVRRESDSNAKYVPDRAAGVFIGDRKTAASQDGWNKLPPNLDTVLGGALARKAFCDTSLSFIRAPEKLSATSKLEVGQVATVRIPLGTRSVHVRGALDAWWGQEAFETKELGPGRLFEGGTCLFLKAAQPGPVSIQLVGERGVKRFDLEAKPFIPKIWFCGREYAQDATEVHCRHEAETERREQWNPGLRWGALGYLDAKTVEAMTPLQWAEEQFGFSSNSLLIQDTKTSLKPLARLKKLRTLDLSALAGLKDLSALSDLKALESLTIHYGKFSTLKGLTHLKSLRELSLAGSAVSDLSGIETLSKLTKLNLAGCKGVTDLQRLSKLKALQGLDVSDTAASNLESLGGLSGLRVLVVDRTKGDGAAILGLSGLRVLSAADVSFANLSGLRQLQQLRVLRIGDKNLRQLNPLGALTQLTGLSVAGTSAKSLAGLSNLSRLRWLDASATKLSSLKHIAQAPQLEFLSVSETKVRSLKPLKKLAKLVALRAASTGVRSLEPLRKLPLRVLVIDDTKVKDIQVLMEDTNRGVDWVELPTTVSAEDAQRLRKALAGTEVCHAGRCATDIGRVDVD